MALYSLKMRAEKIAQEREHVSGAEKILPEDELPAYMAALLARALHHAKGKADFVNFKVEAVAPEDVEHLDALPISTVEVETAEEGRRVILQALESLGLKNGEAILAKFSETYGMRGAMLLDADTLERLEPDAVRGLRATYMDDERAAKRPSDCKNHFAEAVVLATKVVHAPHIVAEICVSDDPDYVAGYVAASSLGYRRITKLKAMGSPDGGRIFLYRGPREGVADCIRYLEKQCVLVRGVPDSPTGNSQRKGMGEMLKERLAVKKARHLCRAIRLRFRRLAADDGDAAAAYEAGSGIGSVQGDGSRTSFRHGIHGECRHSFCAGAGGRRVLQRRPQPCEHHRWLSFEPRQDDHLQPQ